MSAEQKPICVVIDTNIWCQDSNLLLKTAMGSALLYILKQSNGKIGFPEIIEEEIIRNTVKIGIESVEAINKNFETIKLLMSSIKPYELPEKDQIEAIVIERLAELEELIIRIPFTLEHAKSALRRVNEKTQPNGENNQQFKDSAIWEAILTLLDSYIVHFITSDNQFFRNKKRETEELADNLQTDCYNRGGNVYIYNNIATCLEKLQKEVPPLDISNIIFKIDNAINFKLRRELLTEVGFEITELAKEISLVLPFFTEFKDKLALSFELSYNCVDIQNAGGNERKNAILRIKGSCLYEFNTQILSNLEIDFERIYWEEPSGELGRRGVVYASAVIGGLERINYTFREPVDFILSPKFTWKERAGKVRKNIQWFKQYNQEQKAVLETFLHKYEKKGIEALEIPKSLLKYSEFNQYGDVFTIFKIFGTEENLKKVITELQKLLY
ncbi:MAG TPA: PIN domain-containing protein [Candidatus Obscuribacterales bacterium]